MNKNIQKQNHLLGIFDSGVGGFSVYKQIRKYSDTNCIYYGDCLRAPYGNREESEIVRFIKDDIKFLQDEGVTHFVNACNSMSVLTTDSILKECNISQYNYIDMIRAFDTHAKFRASSKVLVIATVATIRSGSYQEILKKKGVEVFEYAYVDLAEAIENNSKREELLTIVTRALDHAQEIGATHIIYGCTHYPLIHHIFLEAQKNVGWKGDFIDPAVYVAQEILKWSLSGERKFCPYSSKDTPIFIQQVTYLLN